jgi:diaminohydroxyphosphoribosylaminopyrimidine deaminase/5-amino-6-(5-phosphoribosylamino)uracil reductase
VAEGQTERDFMASAIQASRGSEQEDRPDPSPRVGAIVANGGRVLAEGHRGQAGPGAHAEYSVLRQLEGQDLAGASLYTTLEPCTERSAEKVPCAQRLIDSGIGIVYVGMYDPNPRINRAGWRRLRDAGIEVRDFDGDLREVIEEINEDFINQYREAARDAGSQTFDFEQNGGKFAVESSHGTFLTRWTRGASNMIYAAQDGAGYPALAKFARNFKEIDDPSAYDFSKHTRAIHVGEIAVFPGPGGFLLVKVDAISFDRPANAGHTSVTISWEARGCTRQSAGR